MQNRLKHYREAAGWSQGELARRLGVSRQTINAVESGDSIAVAGIVRASDLQTGRRGGARLHMLMQLRDGRIGMANILIDYLGFFESMGRLPPRILDQCLLGHLAPGLSRERA